MFEVIADHISFDADAGRGEDGAVWYLILGAANEAVVCSVHGPRTHHYERQAFRRGGPGLRPGATAEEIAGNKANIWGWNGETEAITVSPSFLAAEGRPYRLHSFLTRGALELCGDSTVVLSSLSGCWGS